MVNDTKPKHDAKPFLTWDSGTPLGNEDAWEVGAYIEPPCLGVCGFWAASEGQTDWMTPTSARALAAALIAAADAVESKSAQ